MPRFVQILQIIIALLIAVLFIYDFVFTGISLFENKYTLVTLGLFALLELALFVIYMLIVDD